MDTNVLGVPLGFIRFLMKLKTMKTPNEDSDTLTGKRGWHAKDGIAPRLGKGSATVDPLRRTKDISAIKGVLSHRPRDFALFVFGIHAGLRGGDLLSVRWTDILTPDGKARDKIKVLESKTKKCRILTLQENAREALTRWRDFTEHDLNGYVFPNSTGERLTIQRLHQLVNQWASLAGVKGHFGSHTLRKTYGYHMRRAGVGIETLMKVFGHSSQSITLRYIGIEEDEIAEANLKISL